MTWRLRWRRVFSALLVIVALGVLALYLLQDRMIYLPRPYPPGATRAGYEPLLFHTAQGEQCAYLRQGMEPPRALWVLFGGNAALALDWSDVVAAAQRSDEAFLLIDYPGYGACEGKPSPRAIAESGEAALAALAARLDRPVVALEAHMSVLGHSLGAAAALQFAARHPVERVVLVAPFTTLREMARRSVGWPLCWLLKGNFDNRARMRELAARASPPRLAVLHGEADQLIPPAMGREIAGLMPGAIFHAIPGAGHNGPVLDFAELLAAMRE